MLATRRPARDVFQHSEAVGLPLQGFAKSQQLLLLEFAPDVVEHAARVKDPSQIVDELCYFIGGRKFERIVFDPLTPLIQGMNASESAFRARHILQHLDSTHSVTLYILDLPEAASLAEISKDAAAAVLRFESEGDLQRRTLVIERLPGAADGPRRIPFAVLPGKGITEVTTPAESPAQSARRCVLVASKDTDVIEKCRQVLGEEYDLAECDGPLEAMAQMAAKPFDLLLMDADCNSQHAVRACLELRRNQLNLPILAVGGGYKRLRDRLTLLAQGVDECLQKPVDARLLRIRVRALLKRYSVRERFQDQQPDAMLLEGLSRPAPACQLLEEPFALRRALEQEQTNARRRYVPFSVCWVETENGGLVSLVEVICRLVRPHDLVYRNGRGVAVLMPETAGAGASAFFRRVQAADPSLNLEKACIVSDDTEGFVDRVMTLANGCVRSEQGESEEYSAAD